MLILKRVYSVFGHGVPLEQSRRILREVRILRALRHDNVVALLHVCAPRSKEYGELYLVFEKLDSDLKYMFSREDSTLSLYHVRTVAFFFFFPPRIPALSPPSPPLPPPFLLSGAVVSLQAAAWRGAPPLPWHHPPRH